MIYTLILLSIASLWRPSAEGKAYQYSQLQVGDSEEADDEFGAEKNERGEAGDSEEDDEEDAGLDVDVDVDTDTDAQQQQQLQEEAQEAEKEPAKPPQKVRAQFSIGGEESEEQKPKATSAPLLAGPEETVGKEAGAGGGDVRVTVNQPVVTGDAAGQSKVKKVKVGKK